MPSFGFFAPNIMTSIFLVKWGNEWTCSFDLMIPEYDNRGYDSLWYDRGENGLELMHMTRVYDCQLNVCY